MKVKIYKPSKSTMQSGRGKTGLWVLEYETTSARNPEPLMGWCASGDTLNQVQLKFKTQEDAIAYAHAKGWQFTLSNPRERKIVPRNYGDNFKYVAPDD